MMLQKKLGIEIAEKVLKIFADNPKHFGFIKIKKEELAEIENIYSPLAMPLCRDVYTFRAGIWVVMIIVKDWIEVTLLNPYDPNEHYTVAI